MHKNNNRQKTVSGNAEMVTNCKHEKDRNIFPFYKNRGFFAKYGRFLSGGEGVQFDRNFDL